MKTIHTLVHMKFYSGRKVHLGVLESWLTGYGWEDSIPVPLCHTHSNYLGQLTDDEVSCEKCLII